MEISDIPLLDDKKIVLVCDDSKTSLQTMKVALSRYYHVITASSGYEALSFATLYSPDVIILDIMMYGLNGFETLVKLHANPITQDIPVIFLTGLSEDKYIEKSKELGAADYMVKPFDLAKTIIAIENAVTVNANFV